MRYGSFALFTIIALLAGTGFTTADRLPNQTPENQVFTVDTVIDATGAVDSGTDMTWLVTSPGTIETGTLASHDYSIWPAWGGAFLYPAGKVIADVVYQDSMLLNGGKLSYNENIGFDSKNKALGLYNIESEKVLTYAGTEGAHMVGEEEYTLDVAGEAKKEADNIRCVFSTTHGGWLPPFCNVVTARSALINMNSAQVSTKGEMRAVAKTDDIPTELNYQIAVTPDANSGSGFAEGTVKTTYAGSIMEARGSGAYINGYPNNGSWYNLHGYHYGDDTPWDALIADGYPGDTVNTTAFKTSAENSWKDDTTVTGGIKAFQKAFGYQSGFKL